VIPPPPRPPHATTMPTNSLAHYTHRSEHQSSVPSGGKIRAETFNRMLSLCKEEGLSPEAAAARFGLATTAVRELRKALNP
jgi:hypothetical protein